MRRVAAAVLLVLAAVPAAAEAAPAYKPPVAVLPFKNLNDDPDTDWLRQGISETMLTDLEKAGTPVVERDQIDKALGEILLQGATGTEDADAVKVGRLVGAKTVVVGSFQQAGKQLRMNARFVEVETGVVLDSAKTTGPTQRVFALQDEIVAKLLGRKPPPRRAPKKAGKTVEAYRLYAMSLATASDADRVRYLKKSLSLDPSFVYAAEELDRLEKRLAEYAKQRETAGAALDRSTFAMLSDPDVPAHEKQWRAGQLLTRHLAERRCKSAVADAKRVLDLRIPDPEPGIVGANENALNTLVLCYRILGQEDLALQAGESLLERFPAGAWYKTTERQVKEILEWRKDAPERAAEIDARFAELEAERAALREKAGEMRAKLSAAESALASAQGPQRNLAEASRDRFAAALARTADEERAIDLERCWFPRRLDAERTVAECRAFQAKYAEVPAAAADVRQAREQEIEALGELGRWDEAIPAARAFLAASPEDDGLARNLRSLVEHRWPTDAVP